jgi:hypothetical protein
MICPKGKIDENPERLNKELREHLISQRPEKITKNLKESQIKY